MSGGEKAHREYGATGLVVRLKLLNSIIETVRTWRWRIRWLKSNLQGLALLVEGRINTERRRTAAGPEFHTVPMVSS